jgi:diguanylate cyclase (GGDEF)-like protein
MLAALAAAVERRRRTGERASLLLIDVDGFKEINDALGHAEGDRVLKDLVALVGQRLRKVDALFRAGGEEFALLLSAARLADAVIVAENLRRLVQDAGLVPGRRLSISIGAVELGQGQSVADWIAEADPAMYRAKRAGRNRVAARSAAAASRGDEIDTRLAFPVRTS